MKMLRIFARVGGALFVALVVFYALRQQSVLWQLDRENSRLLHVEKDLEALREENAQLAKERIEPTELERLRAGQSELIRLRGQVAQLRRQLTEATNRLAAAAKSANTPPAESALPPYETYAATVAASVPWQQALVVGGWKTSPGKQTVVFIEPQPVDGGAGQVELQARLVEMPESALHTLGLDGLKAGDKESTASVLLSAEQAGAIAKGLEQIQDVDVLSAPRVITTDGRQAQVKVGDVKTAPSGEQYELGPTIDLTPKISDDRTTVLLRVNAQLRMPTAPAK